MGDKIKFNQLQYGKEYRVRHKALPYPDSDYIGRIIYLDDHTVTMRIKIKEKPTPCFPDPQQPYNIGLCPMHMDYQDPLIQVWER